MIIDWTHAGPPMLAAFLASLVEFVEALTVVLAVGTMRGWRGALAGSGGALLVLLAIIAVLGPALTRIPLGLVQLAVGTLLLLFGMRWLRKAILRSSGVIPMHDEAAAFAKETEALRSLGRGTQGWDKVALAAAFKITMLEGIEVVFIVIAVGAGGADLLIPASAGALAALVMVVALGVILHRPLKNVPENAMKFVVGVLLSAFGTFWVGEGIGLGWIGGDWSIPPLVAAFLVIALFTVPLCRARRGRGTGAPSGMKAMTRLRLGLQKAYGLFVDDGHFAAAILLWLGAVWLIAPHLARAPEWQGIIQFAGLALILVESVTRRARG
jgi:uncharacterized membrane protein